MRPIRLILPAHLQALAGTSGELRLEVEPPVTLERVLDALEGERPELRGTVRRLDGSGHRPLVRFYAQRTDLTHQPPDRPLPEAVVEGREPLLVVGAIAGG